MRTMVVLPAPFGPSSPNTVPLLDLEVDPLERLDLAEALRDLFGPDDGWHGRHPTTLLLTSVEPLPKCRSTWRTCGFLRCPCPCRSRCAVERGSSRAAHPHRGRHHAAVLAAVRLRRRETTEPRPPRPVARRRLPPTRQAPRRNPRSRRTIAVGGEPIGIIGGGGSDLGRELRVRVRRRTRRSRASTPPTSKVTDTIAVGALPLRGAGGRGVGLGVELRGRHASRASTPRARRSPPRSRSAAAPEGLALAAGSVWVVCEESDAVGRIDPATDTMVDTVKVEDEPRFATAAFGSVWVSNYLGVQRLAHRPREREGHRDHRRSTWAVR